MPEKKFLTLIDFFLKRKIAVISIVGGILFVIIGILGNGFLSPSFENTLHGALAFCWLAKFRLISASEQFLEVHCKMAKEFGISVILIRLISLSMVILGLVLIQKGRELKKEISVKGKIIYFLFFLSLFAFVASCFTGWFLIQQLW